jgi:hypothetical protein
VVLEGSVRVPLATENYHQMENIYNSKAQEPVEIGRGGIVAFSHWNHGGGETTPKHIYPRWDPTELGFDKVSISPSPLPPVSLSLPLPLPPSPSPSTYGSTVCDEWVRTNLEEPVGASQDSPPAAWRTIWDFLDEVERSVE